MSKKGPEIPPNKASARLFGSLPHSCVGLHVGFACWAAVVPFCQLFLGGGKPPTKIDYRKKVTLLLNSLLEDLGSKGALNSLQATLTSSPLPRQQLPGVCYPCAISLGPVKTRSPLEFYLGCNMLNPSLELAPLDFLHFWGPFVFHSPGKRDILFAGVQVPAWNSRPGFGS